MNGALKNREISYCFACSLIRVENFELKNEFMWENTVKKKSWILIFWEKIL